jgi:hypothetical protein
VRTARLQGVFAIATALTISAFAARAQAPAIDPFLGIPAGGGPIDVGSIPAGIDAVDAASCGACHRRHYREWERSAHHTSYTNPIFQDEFGSRRSPFCARCHAPRPDRESGIDCAACHVRDGAVLSTTVSGRAPHASRETPELAGTLACARCHQFEFEGQTDELLQRTVDEWMASAHRGTNCQGCHMRAGGAHHAHDFPGGLDTRLLRDAITVVARATHEGGRTRVHFELSANGAGHAVPTGDIFRRVELRAWPEGEEDMVESVLLGRRFRVDHGWHEREDRRIPASGSLPIDLTFGGNARRVVYTIDLWRTHPDRARENGWSDRDVRRRLASGTVRAER